MNAVSVPVSCAGEKNLEIRHSDVTVELRVATKLKILITVEGSAESMQATISYDMVYIIMTYFCIYMLLMTYGNYSLNIYTYLFLL